ncbi:serine O-acetyltransferase [Penaeicola halotolerans]|uniref:serine O-acetyltransferase n=1 Tax=Penaeicola halotolerans TaxID=2793196 RepID=UPI001CF83FAA|nr:serine O-acetyltransferase [Penaeicola halotolerans]
MNQSFIKCLFALHQEAACCPPPRVVVYFHEELIGLLYPEFSELDFPNTATLEDYIKELKQQLILLLEKAPLPSSVTADQVAEVFFGQLPLIREAIDKDVQATYDGDPAAQSTTEVIRTYPGFYAIASYRLAHALHQLGVALIPRMITEHAHSKTGIDIHPGAEIGAYFCIDHGTGIVIGETAKIGDHVKIYQGVTLGALSVHKEDAAIKRHPTIGERVVLYSGATILGGETVIGHDSIIGGNVWLTRSVAPFSKVYYRAQMTDGSGNTDMITFKP